MLARRRKAARLVYTAADYCEGYPLLKAAIVILMLALLASLGSGFYYLMLDQGNKQKRRTFHSLGVRLSIAATLIILIAYGVASGKLGHGNPWDAGPNQSPAAQKAPATP
jgi:succinate dehydrogenase/fumarate reductase cytochrome b subunit